MTPRDMDAWPGCRTVTGLDVPKPHLRLVTNEPETLPGKPPHVVIFPAPVGPDLGARARRRQRLKVKAATWGVPALLFAVLLWLVVAR